MADLHTSTGSGPDADETWELRRIRGPLGLVIRYRQATAMFIAATLFGLGAFAHYQIEQRMNQRNVVQTQKPRPQQVKTQKTKPDDPLDRLLTLEDEFPALYGTTDSVPPDPKLHIEDQPQVESSSSQEPIRFVDFSRNVGVDNESPVSEHTPRSASSDIDGPALNWGQYGPGSQQ